MIYLVVLEVSSNQSCGMSYISGILYHFLLMVSSSLQHLQTQPPKVITLKTALLLNTGKKRYGQPLQTII